MKTNHDTHGQFTAPGEVRLFRLLPGPIERVWEYLTDPEKRGRWLATGPMELKVGGRVELNFNHADLTPHPEEITEKYKPSCSEGGEACHSVGKVTRCEPPRLLSYTWSENNGSESEVTFELSPEGDGVRLLLTHRKLGADRAIRVGVAAGWHAHVGILIAKLEGSEPAPFWSTHAKLEAEYDQLLG